MLHLWNASSLGPALQAAETALPPAAHSHCTLQPPRFAIRTAANQRLFNPPPDHTKLMPVRKLGLLDCQGKPQVEFGLRQLNPYCTPI